MLSDKVDLETISKYTNLTLEEIESLKNYLLKCLYCDTIKVFFRRDKMNIEKELYLQKKMQSLTEEQNEIKKRMQELGIDEKVKEYIKLTNKNNKIVSEYNSFSRQITTLHRRECENQGHPVVLFLGTTRDEYEGRIYYEGYCLNCEQRLTYPKANMEYYRMLNLKDGVVNIHEMIDKATEEYRLFRDCYYKYPGVLKDTEHSNRIIYKAMRKRYENR